MARALHNEALVQLRRRAAAPMGPSTGNSLAGGRVTPVIANGTVRSWRSWSNFVGCVLVAAGCSSSAKGDGDAPPTAGGSVVEQCFADLTAGDRFFVEVQSFEADAGAVRLWRARWPGDGNAVGETFPYELARFAVESEADTACVRDAASLSYQFGHHNWNEVWEARTEAARYVGTEVLNEQWQDMLTVYPLAGDTPTFGPAPMVATGCYTLPYNLNPCLRRDRTDERPADWE